MSRARAAAGERGETRALVLVTRRPHPAVRPADLDALRRGLHRASVSL